MAHILSMPQRTNPLAERKRARKSAQTLVRRRVSMQGLGDSLSAHGGIFRHDNPRLPYQSLDTSAYHDGALGEGEVDTAELAKHMHRLTIVVGCTGLLIAGFLLNQLLTQARVR